MLLNSVILVLQETLEAAVLISVLIALGRQQRHAPAWLVCAVAMGLVFATLYAMNIGIVSGWFDYVGQEVVNALLQILIVVCIVVLFWAIFHLRPIEPGGQKSSATAWFRFFAAAIVALAMTREGSEIVLYLGGFLHQPDKLPAVLIGSGIGFGIGLSVGLLLFYAVTGLARPRALRVAVYLLALFAGNMLAQSVMLLSQADWIAAGPALWDSSAWLPERSITGRLLYALVGYEATPSKWHVISYIAGFMLVVAVALHGARITKGRLMAPADQA